MPVTEDNERDLVAEAKRGGAQALATLLQMNYAVVLRYLVKLTMDARAAEDAAQDAMERAIRSFASYDPDRAKFSTWLVAIARNSWLDAMRKNRRAGPMPENAGEEDGGAADPYAELIEGDELLSALGKLDARARTPVTMCYMLGYSYEEIAGHMKIPLGTVKSRISNALKRLRKELGQDEA
jgi:RNA polymerase sigma-70 factor (ECF subfamily)